MRSLVAAALLVAGCFNQLPADGSLLCNPGPRACPSGFHCETDGACWRNGRAPDLALAGSGGDGGGSDGGGEKNLGAPCAATSECGFGYVCVDGVCCESSCGGRCQACNLPLQMGVCSTVSDGQPHGNRTVCDGAGTACQGTCNGTSPTMCTYPTATTFCGASCDGTCDGAGNCSATDTGGCANGLACSASGCLTQCSGDGDCQTNFHCVASACLRIPESDCLDGVDNNGDGLADCADPSCNDQVQCIPALPLGDQYGTVLPTPSPCPAGTSSSQFAYRDLIGGSYCDACECAGTANCTLNVYLSSATACPNQSSAVGTITVDGEFPPGPTVCLSFTAQTVASVYLSDPTLGSTGCLLYTYPPGTPHNAPANWGAIEHFCAVQRNSPTCGANQICVPKASPAPICLQVPTPGATCPSGFNAVQKTIYANSTDNRVCSSCVCGSPTGGSGSCSTIGDSLTVYSDGSCQNEVGSTSEFAAECGNITSQSIGSIGTYSYNRFVEDTPECGAPTRTGSGAVAGAVGSTVCCSSCGCANPPCLSPICSYNEFCDGVHCQTCNTPQFCGTSCTSCGALADTCVSGSRCSCGASADEPCDATKADSCTAGTCQCGTGAACGDGPFGSGVTCTGGKCMCGAVLCDPSVSNGCSGGVCKCDTGAACTGGKHCLPVAGTIYSCQ